MKKRQEIYDLYWYFACERQNIFINRLNGKPFPWTEDSILKNYKFCNSYRVNDRVSQYLLQNVIYTSKTYSKEDTIFRIVLFKIFNKESTWELLEKSLGEIKLENFNKTSYSNVLKKAQDMGEKIYNDAYISCANKVYGYDKKHENHLELIYKMFLEDKLAEKIINSKSMEEGFNLLKNYPLIGNFMAYQLITDINYSEAVSFSESEFTVAGPGSERGIRKCFEDIKPYTKEEIIKYMYENQEKEFKRLGLNFIKIPERKLQLIDIQNIFCELDKYLRAYRPELKSNRIKIKKKYAHNKNKIEYIYPQKWEK